MAREYVKSVALSSLQADQQISGMSKKIIVKSMLLRTIKRYFVKPNALYQEGMITPLGKGSL